MAHQCITLSLPSDENCLPLVNDAARHGARILRFPRSIEDMVAMSVLEACEALLRRSREQGNSNEYTLRFHLHDDALLIEMTYDAGIPLNPHVAGDYKIPALDTALSEINPANMDSLWLHIIKTQMDRVFFQVKGASHVLKMIKYRRSEGRERLLWVLELSPALKKGVSVDWIEEKGHPIGGLLSDARSGKVLRLGRTEASLVSRMDGRTTLYDIYLTLGPFDPKLVVQVFEALESADMLASPGRDRKASKWLAVVEHFLNPVFTIPRADAAIETVYRMVRPLISPIGVALCLLAGLSGLIPLVKAHELHKAVFISLEEMAIARISVLIVVYLMMMIVIAVHELAHGLVCKHYGGRVPRLGIMFYLVAFIFFCDTTSAWKFREKGKRIMVSLGGPLTTFAFLGVGLWLSAHYADTGSFWEPVWGIFTLACFLGLAMNFNPFIRMDAYYILMDWIGIPNLRERSFNYLKHRVLRPFTKESERSGPAPKPKEIRIFLLYGLAGFVMTLIFFVLPIFWYAWLLFHGSPYQGRFIWGMVVVGIALSRLLQAGYRKLHAMRYREYKLT